MTFGSTEPKADRHEHEEKLAKRNAKSVQQTLLELNAKIGGLTEAYSQQQIALAAALVRIDALEQRLQFIHAVTTGTGPTAHGSNN